MSYFFSFLRYPLIFFFVVSGIAFYSKAHAATLYQNVGTGWHDSKLIQEKHESRVSAVLASCKIDYPSCYQANLKKTFHPAYPATDMQLWNEDVFRCSANDSDPKCIPEPCKTPKTDDQCNKGKTATITGNDVFWATGNYKGCTFTAKDGVFVKAADGTMTGDATSTGSTRKAWCETTDSSYNPADDEALSKNPAFSPAKDNDPKNCKNGWVQAGGGKFHCLNDTSGNVDAPPDKVNPDGSINSDKDGKPKPSDAGVGKPPTGGTDPDGGGGTSPDGGGGDCEGEDCEGGGGTKPPARPADPWADILDAADVARVKADTQSVQDELADFYRSAASGFQININKPAAGAMPSYGDITQGGQKISLSMSWLDKISFADGRAGVLVLCSLIAAYIILVRR